MKYLFILLLLLSLGMYVNAQKLDKSYVIEEVKNAGNNNMIFNKKV